MVYVRVEGSLFFVPCITTKKTRRGQHIASSVTKKSKSAHSNFVESKLKENQLSKKSVMFNESHNGSQLVTIELRSFRIVRKNYVLNS